MKDINLIKELNEKVREKDEFEKALEEAGIEFDLGDGDTEEMEYTNNNEIDTAGVDPELERIADHWREEGADMSDEELRDAIGNDLEQLEYSPEEVSDGIDKVMDLMLDRGEDDEDWEGHPDEYEPDVDERQEHEDFEQADEYFGGTDERM